MIQLATDTIEPLAERFSVEQSLGCDRPLQSQRRSAKLHR